MNILQDYLAVSLIVSIALLANDLQRSYDIFYQPLHKAIVATILTALIYIGGWPYFIIKSFRIRKQKS